MQLFERVTVPSPKTKTETETRGIQDQDQDQDWGSKTKTETKNCKNASRDVSRPRLKSWELQVWEFLRLMQATVVDNYAKFVIKY